MFINIGDRVMIDTAFEIVKEDCEARVDKSHIYDLTIYQGNERYCILMFGRKTDRDNVYNDLVEAMKQDIPYDVDLFDLYDVKYNR